MSILFFSDLHMDAVTRGQRRMNELKGVLDVIENYALNNDVQTVIFGGDWCDPTNDGWVCIGEALAFDAALRAEGVDVLWITGNHDVVEDGLGSSTLTPLCGAGASVIRAPGVLQVKLGGKTTPVGFLPFVPRAFAYDPADVVARWAIEQPTMVFGHLNLKGATAGSETTEMPRGREVQWPLEALAQHLPKASLYGGHYHGHGEINGVEIVGSPALFTFGEEANTPGFLVIDEDGHTFVPIEPKATFRTLQYDPDTQQLYYKGINLVRGETVTEAAQVLHSIVRGAFVRVQTPRDIADSIAIERDLLFLGALHVEFNVGASEVQPAAAGEQPLQSVGDGFAEAKRLAQEWATADAELKQAIVALVAEVTDQACSS